jgi:hypothetical protein
MHFTGTSMHVVCHQRRPSALSSSNAGPCYGAEPVWLACHAIPFPSISEWSLSHRVSSSQSYRVIRIVTNSRLRKVATPGRNSRPLNHWTTLKHILEDAWIVLNPILSSNSWWSNPEGQDPNQHGEVASATFFLVVKTTLESSFWSRWHCIQIPKAEDGIHSFCVHQNCSKLCWSQSPTANYTWNHSGCRMARRSAGIDTYQLYKLFQKDRSSTLVRVNAWIQQSL